MPHKAQLMLKLAQVAQAAAKGGQQQVSGPAVVVCTTCGLSRMPCGGTHKPHNGLYAVSRHPSSCASHQLGVPVPLCP
jgi:hypothetical protein